MMQRRDEMAWYFSTYPDARFFPPRLPWGQRIGRRLGIPYRGLTALFMGNAEKQAEAILRDPERITRAVGRAIDAALIPSRPHRYRLGLGLRFVVRQFFKPVVLALGFIPGVEALAWDVPRAFVNALAGRRREALMTLALATLDFAPALVAVIFGLITAATGFVPVLIAGAILGWLTEWRYFHPYIRKHYSNRDERVMLRMLAAFDDPAFVQRRSQVPGYNWDRAFPEQTRYALAITRYGARGRGARNLARQSMLKATHAALALHITQVAQTYKERQAELNALLATTHGQLPSRWHPIKRHRMNVARADMLDAYEAMLRFWRINMMHRLLYNAYATRNAIYPPPATPLLPPPRSSPRRSMAPSPGSPAASAPVMRQGKRI